VFDWNLFIYLFYFFCGAATQCGSWPPHSWCFLDHTQWRITVGRTPLDECTSHRVYLIWQLLYMFRASLSPIFRSTKQLRLQHLVTVTPYCCLLLSWKSWNWFECVVGGVLIWSTRHLHHTQISSNSSTIAADNNTV